MKHLKSIKSVQILGKKFSVDWKENDPRLYGSINYRDSMISLNSEGIDDDEIFWETLIHEMIHGLLNRIAFHMPTGLDEIICDCIPKMINDNFNLQVKTNGKKSKKRKKVKQAK